MKTLPTTACATLLFAGSVLAEQSIKPRDSVAFRTEVIGCASFDDAIEAARLKRENPLEAAKFVERQHAMAVLGDHNRDCQIIDQRDGRAWPVWEVDFGSSKLTPGTFAVCISPPSSAPQSPPVSNCASWVIVRVRDVVKK